MSHSVRTSLSSGAIIRPTRIQKSVDAALKCKSPLVHHQVLHRAQRHLEARRLSVKAEASTEAVADQTKWGPNHILVAIIDSNPLLGSNSKSTLEMAASISSSGSGKLSILFIDDEGAPAQSDRLQMIQNLLKNTGYNNNKNINILEESVEHSKGKASVALGEVVDAVDADLVVLHSSTVHEGHVDGNLLAEFVTAPVLLLP